MPNEKDTMAQWPDSITMAYENDERGHTGCGTRGAEGRVHGAEAEALSGAVLENLRFSCWLLIV